MPGAKRKEHEVMDVYEEFVKTAAERQVILHEHTLLGILENLRNIDGRAREKLEKAYFAAHKNSLLCGQDLEALGRLTEMLNVLTGRAAIRGDVE